MKDDGPNDEGNPIPVYWGPAFRGPDDEGSAGPAYGVAPLPLPGLMYAGLRVPKEDIPIFTLHDVLAILEDARQAVLPTIPPARHAALEPLREEFEKRLRGALRNEIDAFHRSRR
jgi:hypothetical protein